jgi:hypothetical protein
MQVVFLLYLLAVNGISINGANPNGSNPNGTSLGVVTVLPLVASTVVAATLSDGTSAALRVGGGSVIGGVWSFDVDILRAGVWEPLCAERAQAVKGAWNIAEGVPGGGSYDPTALGYTVVCRGSTISKCVELGYKPWLGRTRELASCVRALRADFCGDGTPYTKDGTIVNLYDAHGVQRDTERWKLEAAWSPTGATCITSEAATRAAQVVHRHPHCALNVTRSCTFSHEALVLTELR